MRNLREVADIGTERTQDYKDLLNKRLAVELTKNGQKGMNILADEENPVPFEELNTLLKNPDLGVHFEADEDRKIIRANVLNSQNERLEYLFMTTNQDSLFINIISQKTYEDLCEIAIDPLDTLVEVQGQLEKAI
jgi:hypothetical protein